jgi:spore germination cell wall hydrolase CwlJ-like protein
MKYKQRDACAWYREYRARKSMKKKYLLGGLAIAVAGALACLGIEYAVNRNSELRLKDTPKRIEQRIFPDEFYNNLERKLDINSASETKPAERKPVSYKTSNFSKDSDEVLLARMLFGEARNCSDEEKVAVAYTALNRAKDGKKWNGTDIRGTVLKKWQYSCFNSSDPNREKLMNPEAYDSKAWEKCLEISTGVLAGKCQDPTNGATHYFNPSVVSPKWAKSMERKEVKGTKHEFYRKS